MLLKPTHTKRKIFFIIGDILISLISLYLAYNLRFNFDIEEKYYQNIVFIAIILIYFKISFIKLFKLYEVAWRFFSLNEAKKLFQAHLLAYTVFIIIYYIFPQNFNPFPRSVLIIDLFLSMIFIGFFRFLKRLIIESNNEVNLKKALVIGVSNLTQTLFKENKFYISDIIDDDINLVNSYISNIKVKSINEIENILKENDIQTVIIAKEFSKEKLSFILDRCAKFKITDIKILLLKEHKTTLKQLSIEDLLARKPKDLDIKAIKDFINNKKVLITGAGGSIGSEIAKICEQNSAKELILVENSEFNLYSINEELNCNKKLYLVDVSKIDELKKVFEQNKNLDIIIHAAAYKHVPLCEINPRSAVINNIIGTKNVFDLAVEFNVKNFILISTDKAVRPTNIMGATKRVCELYVSNADSKNTKVSSVRFGNVLGSSGSVIPKFKKLIEQNKPLTITHPEITRYFMLISEACQLVLQAGSLAKNKELFVLDMGKPVKIVDLAKKMLKLYGKSEDNIKFIGLRPGEKLYEELLIDKNDKKTIYESIYITNIEKYDIKKLNIQIQKLSTLTKKEDIIKSLKDIVKEFNPQNN